jgi:hypothetical protein
MSGEVGDRVAFAHRLLDDFCGIEGVAFGVNMGAEPIEDSTKLPETDVVPEIWLARFDSRGEARRPKVPQRVRGEVPKEAVRPVNVLKHALVRVSRGDAEYSSVGVVPGALEIVHR